MVTIRAPRLAQQGGLEQELAFYETHRAEYLERFKGLFVLIKGTELLGVFPTAEAAYAEGLSKFDLEPFLVKHVLESESIGFIPAFFVAQNARL